LGTLHFIALTQTLLSKVKGPALAKERGRTGFIFFSLPKVGAHNRVPSRQLYYLVTEPLLILLLINEKGSNSKKNMKQ
jgi:hypothetical protein